jgi:hypothetical protein
MIMANINNKKKLPSISNELNKKLLDYSSKTNTEVLTELQTSINGLSEEQYKINFEKFGPNNLGSKKQHR